MDAKNISDIKNLLFKKVKKYNLKEEILNKIFNKVLQHNSDEDAISKEFTLEFERFLVEQINNGDIDLQIKIIEVNSFLKVLFQRNPKYKVEEKNINRLYEDAVELSIENYDGSDSLSMIILKNMKKMSFDYSNNVKKEKTDEKAKTIQVQEEVIPKKIEIKSENTDINLVESSECEKKEDSISNSKTILIDENDRVDLGFLNLLIKNGIMSRVELSENLKVGLNLLDKVLSGEHKLKENHLISLYKKYNVNDVFSLEEKIRIKCEDSNVQKKRNLEKTSVKQKESEKLYDLSFFKEYITLFKIDKLSFAKLIKCGYLKLEEVLDGKVLVKESLMWELYLEFKATNYEELKNIIETKIQLKKIRDKYKTDMPPIKGNYRGFNIDILNEYFKYSGKSEKTKMAESIGISPQSLNIYLRKKIINSKNMKKIFTYFNVENYDQFIEVILKKISQLKKENDLSFLKEYYNLSKEDYEPLARKIGVTKSTFETYIKNNSSNLSKYLKPIYEYFEVQNYDELKSLIEKRIKKLKLNQENIFDIDGTKLVYYYYKKINMKEREELASILEITPSTLRYYMANYNTKSLPKKLLEKLLEHYNVEKLSDLKKIFDERINIQNNVEENIFDVDINETIYNYYYTLNLSERKELANIMEFSFNTLKYYISSCKTKPLPEKLLKKLLEYYNLNKLSELKKIFEEKINEQKNAQKNIFDIDGNELIHDYYKNLNEEEKEELANIMGISIGTLKSYVHNYKTKVLPEKLLMKLLEHYNVEKLSDLKKIFGEKINSQNNTEENIFDINGNELIHDYYKKLDKDDRKELANIMGITLSTLKNYISNYKTKIIPNKLLKKLLDYYNVEKLSELKEILCQKGTNEDSFDVDGNKLIYDYYKNLNEEEKEELAGIMGVTPLTLKNYISNRKIKPLKEKFFKRLIKHYNVEKLSELKEIFDTKTNGSVSLKNEEPIKNDDSNSKEIPTKVDEHTDIASKVDKNLMFSIMNVNTLNREDYIIVMLLFGGFKGRYYSVESISNFLGIEKEYVLEIYNKCLSEYRNTIVNLLNFKDTEIFLKLEPNEKNS